MRLKTIFLLSLFSFGLISTSAQVTDTTCVGFLKNYRVAGNPGSTFQWFVQGGTFLTSQANDSITIQWGNIPGIYPLTVLETSVSGCNGDTVKTKVLIKPNLPMSILGPTEICQGDTVNLSVSNVETIEWQTGETTDHISLVPSGSLSLYIISNNGCYTDTLYYSLVVHPRPAVSFVISPPIPEYAQEVFLSYTGSPVISWEWYMNNMLVSNNENIFLTMQQTQYVTFTLNVKDLNGCTDSLSKSIFIERKVDIWVPSAFTPNNDGLNDVFQIQVSDTVYSYRLFIFNRWGQEIFESSNPNISWDGKYNGSEAPEGVYTWIITYDTNKYSLYNNKGLKKGILTLYR